MRDHRLESSISQVNRLPKDGPWLLGVGNINHDDETDESWITMNTAQPVAASIESVDFGFLTSTEIEALSVKRIQNPTAFDSLLHPIPGGLYDAALGAFLDNA